ncbi:MAG: Rrf2 family transcriptional regulator [Cyanobacteriota bacterium]
MLTLSSKVTYSISALFELSMHYKGKCLQIKEIASAQNIPISYLEQILLILRKAGFVKSIRGAQGGYKLVHDPSNIKIIDIIKAVDGDLKISNTKVNEEILNIFYKEKETQLYQLFDVSIADLLLQKKTLDKPNMYYI